MGRGRDSTVLYVKDIYILMRSVSCSNTSFIQEPTSPDSIVIRALLCKHPGMTVAIAKYKILPPEPYMLS